MISIPEQFRNIFYEQPKSIHFAYANNVGQYVRMTLTWRYGFLMSFLIHLAFFFIFSFIKVPEMAIFNIFSMLVFIGGIFLVRFGFYYTAINLALLEATIHAIIASYFLGWNSGFNYYIFAIPICIFLNPLLRHPLDIIHKVFWCLASVGSFFISWRYLHDAAPVYEQTIRVLTFLQVSNLLMFSSGISIISFTFGYFVKRYEDALQQERNKSESLLHNILPVSIANRIKQDDKNPVDGFKETSILFADIVGFTTISGSCTPETLVAMLNDVFSLFDDLADKYSLEKIKTIGDAYMVASGIPEYQKDHASSIADMALDMVSCLNARTYSHFKSLSIRVGINSGPAVAGVIGKRKFAYDLWGDTVNTAARMESHGFPGKIQVTESTYNLLKNDYKFVERGEIEIKGKGVMKTYFLEGKRI